MGVGRVMTWQFSQSAHVNSKWGHSQPQSLQALRGRAQEFSLSFQGFSGHTSLGDSCPDTVCEGWKGGEPPSCPFAGEDQDGQRDSTARTRSHSKKENKGFLRLPSALGF